MGGNVKPAADPSGTLAWFSQLLAQERDLRAFLSRALRQRADVSDVIQETYARLLALSPERRSAVRTWRAFLFATARNVARDYQRRGGFVSLDALLEIDRSSVVEGSEQQNPDEIVNLRQEHDLLARVIASLPEKCREVVTLRKIHGFSQKEIALRLGIAPHTVEKHISYGVRLCAARLRDASSGAHPGADPSCRERVHAHRPG
jgi:RNA polymerase sigma-70 factor (ECF subfamily)